MTGPAVLAGWYRDPAGTSGPVARYWDGQRWTTQTQLSSRYWRRGIPEGLESEPIPTHTDGQPEPETASPETQAPLAPGVPPPPPPDSAAGWYRNPTGPGQRYWDGSAWTENYADDKGQVLAVPPPPQVAASGGGDSLVPLGYILALLIPIVGAIIGIVLLTRKNDHGAGVLVLAVVATSVYAVLFTSV